ncbi:uncharacterized protein LOC129755650 [Uranotaenia lowii]|uniref:uncharacterized protein LOC129755650 n=1 Tax=Uranotaenia lowii TaxID=190385 RepID=UPI002479F484|nr:uncharacterized protein LOC129755650 [Uranotaenia lowii]
MAQTMKVMVCLTLVGVVLAVPLNNETKQKQSVESAVGAIDHDPAINTNVFSELTDQTPSRSKRAIIFRPLFVYRQQEIKKQRLQAMRQEQQQQTAQAKPAQNPRPSYASAYPYLRRV